MSRGNPLTTALFWLMYLVGFAALFLATYLPAWLENRELQNTLAQREQDVAAREMQLRALDVQIEHIRTDPAFVERLVRREFGLATQDRETVVIQSEASALPAAAVEPPPDTAARVEAAIETAAHTHPLVSLFVLDRTRPYVVGLSLLLVIAALALLGRARAERTENVPSSA